MSLLFSSNPGCQESHLKRLYRNALLSPETPVTQDMINSAHQQDLNELEQFKQEFIATVTRASELESNTESDIILKLKEDLDRLYEECAGLTGETAAYKAGIKKLVGIVMQAVYKGAGNDETALHELEQEDMARQQHYQLLEIPLVSHLLRPDSPVKQEQLIPVLLGEDIDVVPQIISLFDHEQIIVMYEQATEILKHQDNNIPGAPYAAQICQLLGEVASQEIKH